MIILNCIINQIDATKIDHISIRAYHYVKDLFRAARIAQEKFNQKRKDKSAPILKLAIIFAPEYYDWQRNVLKVLSECNITEKNEIYDDWKKKFTDNKDFNKDALKKSLQFGAYMIVKFHLV